MRLVNNGSCLIAQGVIQGNNFLILDGHEVLGFAFRVAIVRQSVNEGQLDETELI